MAQIPEIVLDAMHNAFGNISTDAEDLIFRVVQATLANSTNLNSLLDDSRLVNELGRDAKSKVRSFAISQRGRYSGV